MFERITASTYAQYKADTDAVASWLATTAKACGIEIPLEPDNTTSSKPHTGRLKGKARKAAKSQSQSSKPPPESPKIQYTLSIPAFETLASSIAGHQPLVRVPPVFFRTLNRSIALRKAYGDFLQSEGSPEIPGAQNTRDSHGYFVSVLERVKALLSRNSPAVESDGNLGISQDIADETKLVNQFDYLELFEPSEEIPSETSSASPRAQPASVRYRAESEKSPEEAIFAFHLLLGDLDQLRKEIQRSWTAYKDGVFDLISVSIATNTAIDLARNLEDEIQSLIKQNLPGNCTSEKLLQVYYAAQCTRAGTDEGFRERPGDQLNFKVYDLADRIFIPAYTLLDAFGRLVDADSILQQKPGIFGVYDPSKDRSRMTDRQKFQEDMVVLLEPLPDFQILCQSSEYTLAEDRFISGLRVFFKTKEHSLWLIFAATIYLDIHHILRERIEGPFDDLSLSTAQISQTILNVLEFHKDLRIENWPRENDIGLEEIVGKVFHHLAKDPIQETKRKFGIDGGKRHQLLKNHPVYCGLLSHHLRTSFHIAGVKFATAWGAVIYTAYLYRAAKSKNAISGIWKDMEIVLGTQDLNLIPSSSDSWDPTLYFQRLALSMGMSAQNLARNKKGTLLKHSSKGPQSLKPQAPISCAFYLLLGKPSHNLKVDTSYIETILQKSEYVDMDTQEGLFMIRADKKEKSEAKKSTAKMSPSQLIHRISLCVSSERLDVTFDYFAMHCGCWKLLRRVNTRCQEHLTSIFDVGYLERENQLPFVIAYIFMAASGSDKAAQEVGLQQARNSGNLSSKALESAIQELRQWLDESNGEIVSKELASKFNIPVEFKKEDIL